MTIDAVGGVTWRALSDVGVAVLMRGSTPLQLKQGHMVIGVVLVVLAGCMCRGMVPRAAAVAQSAGISHWLIA